MEAKKDIKTEIARYLKYNYSKKDVMTYLKRDGFGDAEIAENSTIFNKVDSNYFNNALHFLPALLFLILTILAAMGRFYSAENTLPKIENILLVVILVSITIGFSKNKPKFIITTAALIVVSTLYYSYLFFIVPQKDEFGFSLSVFSKVGIIILHLLTLRGCYKMYKETTSKS
ncbi:MAG: hypothetical protein ACOYBS_09360 [Flavobacterium sp.]